MRVFHRLLLQTRYSCLFDDTCLETEFASSEAGKSWMGG